MELCGDSPRLTAQGLEAGVLFGTEGRRIVPKEALQLLEVKRTLGRHYATLTDLALRGSAWVKFGCGGWI